MYINLQGIIAHNIKIFTFLYAPLLLLYEEVESEAKSASRRWADCRIVERHPVWDKKWSASLRKKKEALWNNDLLLIIWFLTVLSKLLNLG